MKQTLVRSILAFILLISASVMVPARPANAAAPHALEMPASLQDAYFAATSQRFASDGDTYTSAHDGLTVSLGQGGLQARTDEFKWGISLSGMGRGSTVRNAQPADIVQTGQQLEYRRGSLTEWYRDAAVGVEQGFVIDEAPRGSGRLVLHLDLNTDSSGQMDADGRGLSFAASDGLVLRYDHLKAYDATGRELESKFIYTPSRIVIQVDDRGGVYPVTIDPFIYLEQMVAAVDGGPGDQFGYSVALSGDTALVGAAADDGSQGSAYVFLRSAGTWSFAARLTASDGVSGNMFGFSVALSGDTALVSAPFHNDMKGAAYVFVKPGDGWETTSVYTAKLTASDASGAEYFGNSVALSGDVALVGSPYHNFGMGAGYVFVKPGGGWATGSETAILTAADGVAGDAFGFSVALSGDTALLGANGDDANQGSAYVFVKPGGGWATGTETAKLDVAGAAGDYFGSAVAISGDTALVGAYGYDSFTGAAYVFVKPDSGWATTSTSTSSLYAPDGAAGDRFGASVAISDDSALVGAYNDDGARGSAHLFVNTGGVWGSHPPTELKLTASDGAALDQFGLTVALSDENVLVGALNHAVEGDPGRGSAYFFQAHYDLGVTAAFSVGVADPGDTIYVTATVANYGPSYSAWTTAVDASLPAALLYVGDIATAGSYDDLTGVWTIGPLAPGMIATLVIEVVLDVPGTQTFTASLNGTDLNNGNNAASASLRNPAGDYLLNGGFNDYVGVSKVPSNWSSAKFSAADGKDTVVFQEGTASVKIKGQSGKTKTLTQNILSGGLAGDELTFSFWVKGTSIPSAGRCRGQAILYDGATVVTTKTLNCSNGTKPFGLKTTTFNAPASFTSIRVKFTYSKASGTAYFDNASLLK